MADTNSTAFHKVCTKCGQQLGIDEFYRHKFNRDGRSGECKPCFIARAVDWKNKNKSRVAANNRAWDKTHRQRERRPGK